MNDVVGRVFGQLGLKTNEIKAYMAMLQHGAGTAAEIADTAGVNRPKVYEALKSLEQRGFCMSTGDTVKRYRPVDPESAVTDWVRRRTLERSAANRREEELAQTLFDLLPEPALDDGPAVDAYMRAGVGADATVAMFGAVARRSALQLDVVITSPQIEDPRRAHEHELLALSRGVRVRMIYDRTLLEEQQDRHVRLAAAGAELRVATEPPLKLTLRDNGAEALISLVSRSAEETTATTVAVLHPELSAPFQIMFNRQWRLAQPLS